MTHPGIFCAREQKIKVITKWKKRKLWPLIPVPVKHLNIQIWLNMLSQVPVQPIWVCHSPWRWISSSIFGCYCSWLRKHLFTLWTDDWTGCYLNLLDCLKTGNWFMAMKTGKLVSMAGWMMKTSFYGYWYWILDAGLISMMMSVAGSPSLVGWCDALSHKLKIT